MNTIGTASSQVANCASIMDAVLEEIEHFKQSLPRLHADLDRDQRDPVIELGSVPVSCLYRSTNWVA
jgi:hypothetical protein